jgi:hypothetical protein
MYLALDDPTKDVIERSNAVPSAEKNPAMASQIASKNSIT